VDVVQNRILQNTTYFRDTTNGRNSNHEVLNTIIERNNENLENLIIHQQLLNAYDEIRDVAEKADRGEPLTEEEVDK
jgi:prephenate dehydrogenase